MRFFRLFLAIFVMVGVLATTASAQQTIEPTTTVATTEPQPVPAPASSSFTHLGFSQGVSAFWSETGPDGGQIFVNFHLSGGWDYEQSQYPRSAPTTSWRVNEFWFSFSRMICPAEGGFCQSLAEDYGPVSTSDLAFSGNEKVTFNGSGYSFVFTSDPNGREGTSQEMRQNQEVDGPSCQYFRQNSMRRGTATLALPGGSVMPPSQSGSAYTDWNAEDRRGNNFYTPSCAPGYGGGKGQG